MKAIADLILPTDCMYTVEHIWIRKDGDTALVGISDFAQDQLGEIAFVDMPEADARFEANEDFGTVESLKSVNALYMPVSGEVLETNALLDEAPTVLNVAPYEKGWIIRIRPDNMDDINTLLSAESYKAGL